MTNNRTCLACGFDFEAHRPDKLCCSPVCSQLHSREKALEKDLNSALDRYCIKVKQELDAQVKIYDQSQYSQEFLRGLIPK